MTRAQTELINSLTAIVKSSEPGKVTTSLDKVETEIDDSIELLEELKTHIQEIKTEASDAEQN